MLLAESCLNDLIGRLPHYLFELRAHDRHIGGASARQCQEAKLLASAEGHNHVDELVVIAVLVCPHESGLWGIRHSQGSAWGLALCDGALVE